MPDIHPNAIVSDQAEIAEGAVIGPFCVVEGNARIGAGTVLKSNVFIGEDTIIGENNLIYHGASLGAISQDLKYEGGPTFLIVGNHNIIREYVTINKGTAINSKTTMGNSNSLLAYTHIAHDCHVGNRVIMSNLSTLAGHVTVEDSAVIAGYVGVHQFCRIGCMSMVGGMTKISKDVPPYTKVQGDPCRVFGLNTVGLERNGMSLEERQRLKQAYNILFRSGYNVSQAVTEIRNKLEITEAVSHLINFIESSERGILRAAGKSARENGAEF
jgi:UDP-N-acetylglucosamine acyltransferase